MRVTQSKRLNSTYGKGYYILGLMCGDFELLVPKLAPDSILIYSSQEDVWISCTVLDNCLVTMSGCKVSLENPRGEQPEINKLISHFKKTAFFRSRR